MPYASNADLPAAVRNVLPAAAQSQFREVVNSQLKRGLADDKAIASAWAALKNSGWQKDGDKWVKKSAETSLRIPITKFNEEQRLVFGWASIVEDDQGNLVVDSQGDVIAPEELEKAAYDYMLSFRQTGEMHERIIGSEIVESLVLTKAKREAMGLPPGPSGWWIGHRVPAEVFAKVKSGEYQDFSIGGACEEKIDLGD